MGNSEAEAEPEIQAHHDTSPAEATPSKLWRVSFELEHKLWSFLSHTVATSAFCLRGWTLDESLFCGHFKNNNND